MEMTKRMQFLIFLSTFLGIWLLFHVYVGWRLWSLPLFDSTKGHRTLVIALAVAYAAYPLGRYLYGIGWTQGGKVIEYGGAVWMGILVLLVSALGLVDLVTLFGLVLKPWIVTARTAAIAVALLLSVVAWIGGQVKPRSVAIEVDVPNLPPAADGLVIAHLSDVHLGALIGTRRLRSLIEQVDAMEPDLVALTGDLVDGHASTVQAMVPELERLTAPLGVYSVLGNHEFYAGADRCRKLMREAGFTVLDGSAVEVMPGLWIAGVPDNGRRRVDGGNNGAIEKALGAVDEGAAVVFLQHAPFNEQVIAEAGVGLMLDGHTHGAQIWPAHYLVRREYDHLAGVRKVGAMTQVVSRGAGHWGPPMRLFAPSDMYRITLRCPARSN
jgi:predicted MPP superfamily phosphohydrolase